MKGYDYEPVHGLPAPLPEGETILWQGAPHWRIFARQAMRVRLVVSYFVLLVVWGGVGHLSSGMPASEMAISALRLCGLGAVATLLLILFSWLVGRTTLYTITTRRVVMRFGIALPITIQIPYRMIDAAATHILSDGGGSIALKLLPDQRIAYFVVWPHARSWKLAKPQPSLRGIADAAAAAHILGRALAASAAQPAKAVAIAPAATAGGDAHVPAAA